MCHHSLPGIISPVKDKKNINRLIAADFVTILIAYLLLSISAVFAYGDEKNSECKLKPGPPCKIQDRYNLNFESFQFQPIAIFLALFPVFTLSANFPMIAITLRNNIGQLVTYKGSPSSKSFI
jgi:hypothetical protein